MNVFLFAGEKSGDLHGAKLIQALKSQKDLKISAVAGPEMRKLNIDCIMQTEDFEIMGFSEVFFSLLKIRRQFYAIQKYLLESRPDIVVLIDYPGFNLRLAKSLRQKGFEGKIVQYISPSIWAHGKKRADILDKYFDLVLTIYPFEKDLFKNHSIPVKYVGNPLKETVKNHVYNNAWKYFCGIHDTKDLIAIFPGSRKREIKGNLPLLIESAKQIKKENPKVTFAFSYVQDDVKELIKRECPFEVSFVPKVYSYELMRDCRSAIAKSGSVTLELALHKRPTVVMYKLSILNRLIAKYILRLKLPYYCMVNILSGHEVFPELIAEGLSAENLYKELMTLNKDSPKREQCIAGCDALAGILKDDRASEEAAKAILDLHE